MVKSKRPTRKNFFEEIYPGHETIKKDGIREYEDVLIFEVLKRQQKDITRQGRITYTDTLKRVFANFTPRELASVVYDCPRYGSLATDYMDLCVSNSLFQIEFWHEGLTQFYQSYCQQHPYFIDKKVIEETQDELKIIEQALQQYSSNA